MKIAFFCSYSKSALILATLSLSIGCSREASISPSALTEEISKIETSYKEGDTKIETLYTPGAEKIETKASPALLASIKARVEEYQMAYKTKFRSARQLFGGYDVGVIPGPGVTCPAWSESIEFYMDNEDTNNMTSATGWVGAWERVGNGDSKHPLCRVNGSDFVPLDLRSGWYGVIRLGNLMPFWMDYNHYYTVNIDNQDGNNWSSSTGDFAPNVCGPNTTLRVGIYPYSGSGQWATTEFPDFGFSYGVFSSATKFHGANLVRGEFLTDDEDRNNGNYITVYAQSTNTTTGVSGLEDNMIFNTGNTTFRIIKAR